MSVPVWYRSTYYIHTVLQCVLFAFAFQFNKSNLEDRAARRDEEELQRDQEALQALKSSLKDQLKQTKVRASSVGFDTNLDSLKEEMERKKSVGDAMGEAMGLDGSVEEDNAAKLIQNKFRNLKLKKSPNNGEADSSKKGSPSAKKGKLTNLLIRVSWFPFSERENFASHIIFYEVLGAPC